MPPQVTTVGVYGFTESTFFDALLQAGVSVFCDIRRRRAVRGSRFAFANSKRLQAKLAFLGIHYLYAKELAPSNAIRELQKHADESTHTIKFLRSKLSDSFIVAYQAECLFSFDSNYFIRKYNLDNHIIAFFCVEREPEACHRSLVAERFAKDWGILINHLRPNDEGGGYGT